MSNVHKSAQYYCRVFISVNTLADPKVLSNKRTELISKCCNRSKFTLNKVK